MKKHTCRQTLVLIAIGVIFGVAVALVKGGSSGVRDSVGNISAPWLLLPFFAGRMTRSGIRGAVVGAATCLAALVGFYIAEAFVLDLGGHTILTDLSLTLGAGRLYFLAGATSGPILGAIGGSDFGHRVGATAFVVGLVLIGEPIAVFGWLASARVSSSDTGMVVAYPALWIAEMVLGIVLCGFILFAGSRQVSTAFSDNDA